MDTVPLQAVAAVGAFVVVAFALNRAAKRSDQAERERRRRQEVAAFDAARRNRTWTLVNLVDSAEHALPAELHDLVVGGDGERSRVPDSWVQELTPEVLDELLDLFDDHDLSDIEDAVDHEYLTPDDREWLESIEQLINQASTRDLVTERQTWRDLEDAVAEILRETGIDAIREDSSMKTFILPSTWKAYLDEQQFHALRELLGSHDQTAVSNAVSKGTLSEAEGYWIDSARNYVFANEPDIEFRRMLEDAWQKGCDEEEAWWDEYRRTGPTRGSKPENRQIRTASDAEEAACEWMRYFGFADAYTTNAGADGGVDVASSDAVAQVKAQTSPVGRPVVQQLSGIASHEGKSAIVFGLAGFTRQAEQWADAAGVALFTFDLQGAAEPLNPRQKPDVATSTWVTGSLGKS